MKCSICGQEIANDSNYCENCGAQIVKTMVTNAECKIHVKWLLYVAMLFTCILNYFLFEVQTYEAVMVAFCLLLVQLGIFIPVSFLRYKKRIATIVLVLSIFMLIGNILLFNDALMFESYFDTQIYGEADHMSLWLIYINPSLLLLCMMYEFYSYKKTRQ